MSTRLPVVKLDINNKQKYYIAFVYLPNKTEVCKAKSIRSILTQYKSSPTSHVALCQVLNRETRFQFFLVVGKYSSINRTQNKYFYKIVKNTPLILQADDSKRARYYLIKEEWKDNIGFNKSVEVIYSWRKLPKKHLMQLAYIDDPSLIKKCKEKERNRWNKLEF